MASFGAALNGHKATVAAFLSGAGVVLFGYLVSSLISVGSEREKVLGYIERTEPLDVASTAHRLNAQIHVSEHDKELLATISVELRDIRESLRQIRLTLNSSDSNTLRRSAGEGKQ